VGEGYGTRLPTVANAENTKAAGKRRPLWRI